MSGSNPCPERDALERAFPGEASEALRDHIARCPRCEARWAELTRLAALGRALPEGALTEERRSALRSAILTRAAQAPRSTPSARRRGGVLVVAAAAAVLLTATIALFIFYSSSSEERSYTPPTPEVAAWRSTIHAHDDARFLRISAPPDEIIRLTEGTITLEVAPLQPGERLRVVTGDAEVEVRGTIFEASARGDRLQAVRVLHGRVEVRQDDALPVMLGPSERWAPPVPPGEPAPPQTVAASTPTSQAGAEPRTPRREPPATAPAEAPAQRPDLQAPRPEPPATAPVEEPASAPPAASTAELEYQRGWNALRQGDFNAAATAFEHVQRDPGSPLAADAAYWRAVALGRAGNTAEASAALQSYLRRFPQAARREEASAMLGWMLLERGDLKGAERAFKDASGSSAPAIRQSAERGLDAVQKRAAPTP